MDSCALLCVSGYRSFIEEIKERVESPNEKITFVQNLDLVTRNYEGLQEEAGKSIDNWTGVQDLSSQKWMTNLETLVLPEGFLFVCFAFGFYGAWVLSTSPISHALL